MVMSYPKTVHNCSLQREQWRSASTKKPAGAGFAVVVKGGSERPASGPKGHRYIFPGVGLYAVYTRDYKCLTAAASNGFGRSIAAY